MADMAFQFDFPKTIQVLGYLLKGCGATDKVKLMKLVYLADRRHFIRFGVPITGDRQCAMRHGPAPSNTLDMINGELDGNQSVYRHLHVDDHRVELREDPGQSRLSSEELATLDEIIAEHAQKKTWALVDETHNLPEYKEVFVEGTSTLIPYERIAKYSGSPARFRMERPVISARAASQLPCPFDPDPEL